MKALVTGGMGGIGRATVDALPDSGREVVATAATQSELASLPQAGGLSSMRLDVTDATSVRSCATGLDRLDVLINCAGILCRSILCIPKSANPANPPNRAAWASVPFTIRCPPAQSVRAIRTGWRMRPAS